MYPSRSIITTINHNPSDNALGRICRKSVNLCRTIFYDLITHHTAHLAKRLQAKTLIGFAGCHYVAAPVTTFPGRFAASKPQKITNYIDTISWGLGHIPLSLRLRGIWPQPPLVKYVKDGINGRWHLSIRYISAGCMKVSFSQYISHISNGD